MIAVIRLGLGLTAFICLGFGCRLCLPLGVDCHYKVRVGC